VSHFVTSGGAPIKVPCNLISQLKERVADASKVMISKMPKLGEKMQIIEGPFKGLNAIFNQPDGTSRAVVLVTLLNQQVKASIAFSSLAATD
jgi:transcriptional antiterminator RfaH